MNAYLTTDPDILRCPTCGYEWARDLDGPDSLPKDHSCVPGLTKRIAEHERRVSELRATLASITGGRDSELRPCPFCGSKTVELTEQICGFAVECLACEVKGPEGTTRDEAREDWNKRH